MNKYVNSQRPGRTYAAVVSSMVQNNQRFNDKLTTNNTHRIYNPSHPSNKTNNKFNLIHNNHLNNKSYSYSSTNIRHPTIKSTHSHTHTPHHTTKTNIQSSPHQIINNFHVDMRSSSINSLAIRKSVAVYIKNKALFSNFLRKYTGKPTQRLISNAVYNSSKYNIKFIPYTLLTPTQSSTPTPNTSHPPSPSPPIKRHPLHIEAGAPEDENQRELERRQALQQRQEEQVPEEQIDHEEDAADTEDEEEETEEAAVHEDNGAQTRIHTCIECHTPLANDCLSSNRYTRKEYDKATGVEEVREQHTDMFINVDDEEREEEDETALNQLQEIVDHGLDNGYIYICDLCVISKSTLANELVKRLRLMAENKLAIKTHRQAIDDTDTALETVKAKRDAELIGVALSNENKELQNTKLAAETHKMEKEAEFVGKQTINKEALDVAECDIKQATVLKIDAETTKLENESKLVNEVIKNKQNLDEAEIGLKIATASKIDNESAKIETEKAKLQAETCKVTNETHKIAADTAKAIVETDKIEQDSQKVKSEIAKLDTENAILSLEVKPRELKAKVELAEHAIKLLHLENEKSTILERLDINEAFGYLITKVNGMQVGPKFEVYATHILNGYFDKKINLTYYERSVYLKIVLKMFALDTTFAQSSILTFTPVVQDQEVKVTKTITQKLKRKIFGIDVDAIDQQRIIEEKKAKILAQQSKAQELAFEKIDQYKAIKNINRCNRDKSLIAEKTGLWQSCKKFFGAEPTTIQVISNF